ncbi:MAG TPA: SDR family oxidoreductase [Puia sp.]|nr:SDR family oxidoreductase [Puia sp.]
MDLQLKEKVIIVTGGAKGIGEGISRVLAGEGVKVAIVGRNGEDNQKLVSELRQINQQAFPFTAELTMPEACETVIREIVASLGSIYGLVNNAGLNDGVGLENGNYQRFMESMHNNLVHYYLMAHFALPELIKSKGAIVNITSKSAETGQGGTSAYAAANGGRNALTREWAVELLKYRIRVNAIVVSEAWTPQYANWILKFPDSQARLAEITSRIPLEHRMTTIEEIGNTTAFLLSEKSSHTTGQLIHVDGGYVHLDRALRNEGE